MLGRLRRRLSYANVVASLALFIALGGTSYAALTLTGKNVKDGSLTGQDVRNGSIASADVRDRSLLAKDFKAGQLPAGAQGSPGAPGAAGQKGDKGEPGLAGTARAYAFVDSGGSVDETRSKDVTDVNVSAAGNTYCFAGSPTRRRTSWSRCWSPTATPWSRRASGRCSSASSSAPRTASWSSSTRTRGRRSGGCSRMPVGRGSGAGKPGERSERAYGGSTVTVERQPGMAPSRAEDADQGCGRAASLTGPSGPGGRHATPSRDRSTPQQPQDPGVSLRHVMRDRATPVARENVEVSLDHAAPATTFASAASSSRRSILQAREPNAAPDASMR